MKIGHQKAVLVQRVHPEKGMMNVPEIDQDGWQRLARRNKNSRACFEINGDYVLCEKKPYYKQKPEDGAIVVLESVELLGDGKTPLWRMIS
jgi:hypothetical protein